MDQNAANEISSQDIDAVVAQLPPPVRKMFASGKVRDVSSHIFKTYGLHIDQAGVVQKELLLLLLGINTPDDFTSALDKEAHLQKEIINAVVKDVNEQIFIPLHEEMRNGPKETTPAAPAPIANKEALTQTPPAPEATVAQDPATLPPKAALPRQTAAPATVPAAAPPRPAVSAAPLAAPVPAPQALPAMKPSINKLDGWRSDMPSAPQALVSEMLPVPEPAPIPTPQPANSQAPRTAPPPPNLPGAPAQAPAAQPATPPIVKEYAADPYREPIDDKA